MQLEGCLPTVSVLVVLCSGLRLDIANINGCLCREQRISRGPIIAYTISFLSFYSVYLNYSHRILFRTSMKAPVLQSAAGNSVTEELDEYEATQPVSQDQYPHGDISSSDGVWGSLYPYNGDMSRIDFKTDTVTIGRDARNDVVLKRPFIS